MDSFGKQTNLAYCRPTCFESYSLISKRCLHLHIIWLTAYIAGGDFGNPTHIFVCKVWAVCDHQGMLKPQYASIKQPLYYFWRFMLLYWFIINTFVGTKYYPTDIFWRKVLSLWNKPHCPLFFSHHWCKPSKL